MIVIQLSLVTWVAALLASGRTAKVPSDFGVKCSMRDAYNRLLPCMRPVSLPTGSQGTVSFLRLNDTFYVVTTAEILSRAPGGTLTIEAPDVKRIEWNTSIALEPRAFAVCSGLDVAFLKLDPALLQDLWSYRVEGQVTSPTCDWNEGFPAGSCSPASGASTCAADAPADAPADEEPWQVGEEVLLARARRAPLISRSLVVAEGCPLLVEAPVKVDFAGALAANGASLGLLSSRGATVPMDGERSWAVVVPLSDVAECLASGRHAPFGTGLRALEHAMSVHGMDLVAAGRAAAQKFAWKCCSQYPPESEWRDLCVVASAILKIDFSRIWNVTSWPDAVQAAWEEEGGTSDVTAHLDRAAVLLLGAAENRYSPYSLYEAAVGLLRDPHLFEGREWGCINPPVDRIVRGFPPRD